MLEFADLANVEHSAFFVRAFAISVSKANWFSFVRGSQFNAFGDGNLAALFSFSIGIVFSVAFAFAFLSLSPFFYLFCLGL